MSKTKPSAVYVNLCGKKRLSFIKSHTVTSLEKAKKKSKGILCFKRNKACVASLRVKIYCTSSLAPAAIFMKDDSLDLEGWIRADVV